MPSTFPVDFLICDRTVTARFTYAAMENIEETGADVAEDLGSLVDGTHTAESLLDFCLGEEPESGRAEGWRDYVSALAIAAGL